VKRLLGFTAFSLCVLLPSCDDAHGPPDLLSGSVEYTVSGGFRGGVHTKMTVDPAGHVTLHSSYPELEDDLTTGEQAELERYFADIWSQPDTLRGGCMDDFNYEIRWTDSRGKKIVLVDGCALNPPNGVKPWPTLTGIVQVLGNLAARILEQKAPWRGIEGTFGIDKLNYGLDEPIRFSYRLKNPTSQERSLPFHHADQFWFSVDKENFPGFHYSYPMRAFYPWAFPDSSSPSSIVLVPGQEEELVYVWDHSVLDVSGKPDTLDVGSYHLRMGLLTGDLNTQEIHFDLYDRRLPIKGDIIPDLTGSDGTSATYVFQLMVTNWTQSSVTLHFRNSQRIAVELWDLDFDPPKTIIYQTMISQTSDSQNLTLAPQEKVVFTEAVQKANMGPWYIWTLAKVRLLSTDFDFSREGQLQIFHR